MAASDSAETGGASATEHPQAATGPAQGGVQDRSPELEERLDDVLSGGTSADEQGGEQVEGWPTPKPEEMQPAPTPRSRDQAPDHGVGAG